MNKFKRFGVSILSLGLVDYFTPRDPGLSFAQTH